MIILLTGQPGSGKTTIANVFADDAWFVVDGDTVRELFPSNYDMSGRVGNVDRSYIIARYAEARGFSVIVSVVQPYTAQRDAMKSHGAIEVYLNGRPGERPDEHMVDDYEVPVNPHLMIYTEEVNLADSVRAIHRTLADLS